MEKRGRRQIVIKTKVQNYLESTSIACVLKPVCYSDTVMTSVGCGLSRRPYFCCLVPLLTRHRVLSFRLSGEMHDITAVFCKNRNYLTEWEGYI